MPISMVAVNEACGSVRCLSGIVTRLFLYPTNANNNFHGKRQQLNANKDNVFKNFIQFTHPCCFPARKILPTNSFIKYF